MGLSAILAASKCLAGEAKARCHETGAEQSIDIMFGGMTSSFGPATLEPSLTGLEGASMDDNA